MYVSAPIIPTLHLLTYIRDYVYLKALGVLGGKLAIIFMSSFHLTHDRNNLVSTQRPKSTTARC